MNEYTRQESHTFELTTDYEQCALEAFAHWYQQAHPTIDTASTHAYVVARDTVKGLSEALVLSLIQEHPDWIFKRPEERNASDHISITIGEIARRHLVKHLQNVVQSRGLQAVYLAFPTKEES